MKYLMMLAGIFLFLGCSSNDGGGTTRKGIEGAACYPGRTCDSPLVCNSSNICEKDPCATKYCNNWQICNSESGAAVCEPKGGFCDGDSNCSGDLKRCHLDTHTCVACLAPSDCGSATEYQCSQYTCVLDRCATVSCNAWQECHSDDGKCHPQDGMCSVKDDCSGEELKRQCNKEQHECVECMVAETDCNSDEVCDGFRCVTNNCIGSDCEEWEVCDDSDGSCNLLKNRCYQENDCTPYSNKKCLQASHSCVECLIPSDCGTGKLCTNNMCENDPCYNNSCTAYQQCNSVTGACEYISGRCDSVSHCSGETTRKTCDTESNYCVECLNASDCNVSANEVCDDYNQCQTNQCVGSNCDEWELCDSNDGSCDPKPGRCNLKADCSGSLSACDTDSHTCVECTVKADCTGAGEYCTESNECIVDYCHENSCNGWETCDDSDGSCDLNANRCNSTSDCGSEVCNTTTNYCVECLTKNDCTGDKICNDTNYCVDESSGSVSDLMISEYVEGSANSKCLELYNGIGASINLSNYNLRRTQEGSDFRTSFLLPDYELANNKTYVVCYHNSEADFLDKADLLTDNSNYDALSFSGDDDVALFKGDALIDWVGVGATQGDWGKSVTLIRKSTVTTPSTTYDASEWEEHPENYIDNLGSHTVQ